MSDECGAIHLCQFRRTEYLTLRIAYGKIRLQSIRCVRHMSYVKMLREIASKHITREKEVEK